MAQTPDFDEVEGTVGGLNPSPSSCDGYLDVVAGLVVPGGAAFLSVPSHCDPLG